MSLKPGRWRPISGQPDFANQIVSAKWRSASCTALFALIPNLREQPDVAWQALDGQNLRVSGPRWSDTVSLTDDGLTIASEEEGIWYRLTL